MGLDLEITIRSLFMWLTVDPYVSSNKYNLNYGK